MTTVGKALPHESAAGHVSGAAPYIEDLPRRADELWVEFVGSPCANGTIESIDAAAAKAMPGVVAVLTHEDVPGHNKWGGVVVDEPFFPDDHVSYIGQPIVAIAAVDRETALRARAAVVIKVREEKPVLSVDDGIAAQDFLGGVQRIARGDFAAAWENAPHRHETTLLIGGQEQFYLENQSALAIPEEDGSIVIHASTQNPTEIQAVVAEGLGLPLNKVVCICRRMGGGFGGKETQAAIPTFMVALVAMKTGRSARVVYTKDDDMMVTGKRHEYRVNVKAAFEDNGTLLGVKIDAFSNGGAFTDLSFAVMERTLFHADNAYYIPHFEATGRVCRTNLPPNTAFRGFGGPQGVVAIEHTIQEIAQILGLDPYEVRRRNCYGIGERDETPYGQRITHNTLPEVLDTLRETSAYEARTRQIATYNKTSRRHLKGIAMTPVKFGISFTATFLNQGNALVNVYTDGTVQVSTGGTEMGQGLNTKVRQIVADEFGIPIESVRVMTTSTEKNHNTPPTAASAGTDLNGLAAQNACAKILAGMRAYAAGVFTGGETGLDPDPSLIRFRDGRVFDERRPGNFLLFGQFAKRCHLNRVNIGARGFYATPKLHFDRSTGRGHPFNYYTTGAAVAEVTIDRFTGDLVVDRVDMLMDIGRMINPGIDRGQVIGGFVQGMGWVTTEQLVYSPKGNLLSHSPTTYKIPGIDDVPRTFNVAYLDNDRNAHNVHASKAVGEPPLLLGISVWAAVKDALAGAAPGRLSGLNLPATGEEILRCLTELAAPEKSGTESKGRTLSPAK
ncbi:MAG: xanthine dehydrogenase large subunit [Candidatus Sumerlaeota bacterium]|nr:xanthine dehydrogenase large subunit [Candidatus Sumerlaeota bacterium]